MKSIKVTKQYVEIVNVVYHLVDTLSLSLEVSLLLEDFIEA